MLNCEICGDHRRVRKRTLRRMVTFSINANITVYTPRDRMAPCYRRTQTHTFACLAYKHKGARSATTSTHIVPLLLSCCITATTYYTLCGAYKCKCMRYRLFAFGPCCRAERALVSVIVISCPLQLMATLIQLFFDHALHAI